MDHFRLPLKTVIWRALPKNIFLASMFLTLSYINHPGASRLPELIFLFMLLVSLFFSWKSYSKVWFPLSNEGIHCDGLFFSHVCIRWNSPVMFSGLANAFQGKPQGIAMLELDADGIPKNQKITLPQVITSSEEFKNALRTYAPFGHPVYAQFDIEK